MATREEHSQMGWVFLLKGNKKPRSFHLPFEDTAKKASLINEEIEILVSQDLWLPSSWACQLHNYAEHTPIVRKSDSLWYFFYSSSNIDYWGLSYVSVSTSVK